MSVLKQYNPLTAQWEYAVVGKPGTPGDQGSPGLTAYQVAVNNGFMGTEQEWLDSITAGAISATEGFAVSASSSAASAASSAASVAGSAADIAEVKTAIPLLTNLATNGDFSNGTAGWTPGSSSGSVLDGIYKIESFTTITPYLVTSSPINGTLVVGHKFYLRVTERATGGSPTVFSVYNGSAPISYMNNPVLDTWYTSSLVFTASNNYDRIVLHINYLPGGFSGASVEFDNISFIDLTITFGAGNEPTKAQMDSIMAAWPNSWFSGSQMVPWYNWAKQLSDYNWVGSGSPYNVLTPPRVGIEYTDTAQTIGARKWISTGTTITSWVVTEGDTGLRNITSLLGAGFQTSNPNATLYVRRVNARVAYTLNESAAGTGTGLITLVGTCPSGLNRPSTPSNYAYATIYNPGTNVPVAGKSLKMNYDTLYMIGASAERQYCEVVFETGQVWPTTYPGTAG